MCDIFGFLCLLYWRLDNTYLVINYFLFLVIVSDETRPSSSESLHLGLSLAQSLIFVVVIKHV